MIPEYKNLLIKDLTARLSYGVKCKILGTNETKILSSVRHDWENTLFDFWEDDRKIQYDYQLYLSEFKPYLFPLLSMTEEQKEELFFNYIHNDIYFDDFTDYFLAGELWHDICVSIDSLPGLIDWLNKNHLDYRGLIEKGLALDATRLNIY
jgi:hypothetical protein